MCLNWELVLQDWTEREIHEDGPYKNTKLLKYTQVLSFQPDLKFAMNRDGGAILTKQSDLYYFLIFQILFTVFFLGILESELGD